MLLAQWYGCRTLILPVAVRFLKATIFFLFLILLYTGNFNFSLRLVYMLFTIESISNFISNIKIYLYVPIDGYLIRFTTCLGDNDALKSVKLCINLIRFSNQVRKHLYLAIENCLIHFTTCLGDNDALKCFKLCINSIHFSNQVRKHLYLVIDNCLIRFITHLGVNDALKRV